MIVQFVAALQTLEEAAAWVDRVGLALVFPRDDVVLPSLWHASGGEGAFAKRDDDGKFIEWTKPMDFVWRTKDELPARNLVCAGKHLRGRASLVALDLLPALVAVAHRAELDPLEAEIVELLRAEGPLSARELPDLLPGHERKRVRAAIDRLQKALIATNAGLEESTGWPAIVVDLTERRYAAQLRQKPPPDDARKQIAERVLAAVGELTAEDLRGALGWRKAEAVAALEATRAPSRAERGFAVWSAR
jgi:hypothetical protein